MKRIVEFEYKRRLYGVFFYRDVGNFVVKRIKRTPLREKFTDGHITRQLRK